MPVPVQSKNPYAGIFQYITQMDGTPDQVRKAQAALAQLTPQTAAIYAALNMLPEGELKEWLTANPIQFWKKVIALIKGRKYTRGDYTLAERLHDQIYCAGDIGQTQASDEMVEVAHQVFNQLFGVRIATVEDLDALDFGVSAYKNRAVSQGLDIDAIERAVYLKQHFYPISTYNRQCWDLKWFEIYPLVDRIPDYEIGKWYTGPVIGGANAVDGWIQLSAESILKQIPGGDFDPETGNITTPGGQVIKPGQTSTSAETPIQKLISYVKANPLKAAIIGAAVGYALYETDLEE